MPKKNLLKDAFERGMRPKQEKFAQAIANGANQTESAKIAGYNLNSPTSTLPSRLIRQQKIQERIQELIEQAGLQEMARNVWQDVLSDDTSAMRPLERAKVNEVKLKAIDQIARLGGWEPEQVKSVKNMTLTGSLSDILPK
jgi:phage terminase small subunit